ncbi:MAG TPA: cytochrome c3 family protein [Gemmatimonadaceae bacterium]|nr:cytochrome c3 family protein [Gemmatimonadaceae bacterium]
MPGRRSWALVTGFVVVAAAVAALSAYTGTLFSAQQTAPAADQPIDGINPGQPGYLTLKANLEARGKAPKGPWAYSGSSNFNRYFVGVSRSPQQPINFPHPVHVNTLKLNCVFCHYAADKSPDPGMPAISTCMGCHNTVAIQRPEIQKLKAYADSGKAIPWVRIHKVPDYVQFPHMRHVNAGVTCQACHGQVQNMPRVERYASLNMGWCVNCHLNGYSRAEGMRAAGYEPSQEDMRAPIRKASYDCAVCHY